jgi:hypothetical protein
MKELEELIGLVEELDWLEMAGRGKEESTSEE